MAGQQWQLSAHPGHLGVRDSFPEADMPSSQLRQQGWPAASRHRLTFA